MAYREQLKKIVSEHVKKEFGRQYKKVTSTRVMMVQVIGNFEKMLSDIESRHWVDFRVDETIRVELSLGLKKCREVDAILSGLQNRFYKP